MQRAVLRRRTKLRRDDAEYEYAYIFYLRLIEEIRIHAIAVLK